MSALTILTPTDDDFRDSAEGQAGGAWCGRTVEVDGEQMFATIAFNRATNDAKRRVHEGRLDENGFMAEYESAYARYLTAPETEIQAVEDDLRSSVANGTLTLTHEYGWVPTSDLPDYAAEAAVDGSSAEWA